MAEIEGLVKDKIYGHLKMEYQMGIEIERFGLTDRGELIDRIILKNDDGSYVALLNYGASMQSILVPDRMNVLTDVCLGYKSLSEYQEHGGYLGATIGRCANRISRGLFSIGERDFKLSLNQGANHLHGGQRGFDKRAFSYNLENDGVCFSYDSPDGEEGYPGTLHVKVFYVFTPQHELEITYEACCQTDTLVNLTNHAYFNLDGEGSGHILDHFLQIFSERFCKINKESLPTGEILPVSDTPFDFRVEKRISEDIHKDDEQLFRGSGYDHYYYLEEKAGLKKCASLRSEKTGIKMTILTTKPGVQLYTGNGMKMTAGKTGTYGKRSGVCLETQFAPDAINTPALGQDPILPANHTYYHQTIYSFSTV